MALGLVALLLVPACSNDPVVIPLPGYFSLDSPANGANGVPVTPTFMWEPSLSVETPTYTIQVSTDPGFSSFAINVSGLATTSFTPPPGSPLSGGTLYYWQVLAVRSTGSVASTGAPWSFTTVLATPGPFTMIAPGNTSTGVSLTPAFSWNASVGAPSYTLKVATDSGFTETVVNQTGINGQSIMLSAGTPLLANQGYYWQVIAVSTNNTTATGAPWIFTTGTSSLSLISPSDASSGVSKTGQSYSWSVFGASPASFTLQVSTDGAFGSFAIDHSGLVVPASSETTALAATTKYFWRVLALDSGNNILDTSSSFTFTTGP
jgi:hypothetical protein